jgi:5-methylcytosine-specific restriction endonuclease McrA
MSRLTSIKPRLAPLDNRLAILPRERAEAERLKAREKQMKWRRWYKTSRWRKLRMQILIRDMFTCQMSGCGRIEVNSSLLVADHKVQHHGDEDLFWNPSNLQCLCKPCHDGIKQRMERSLPDRSSHSNR